MGPLTIIHGSSVAAVRAPENSLLTTRVEERSLRSVQNDSRRPTPPPGHVEVTALLEQISSNGGFDEYDLVPHSTLEDRMQVLLARTWIGSLGTDPGHGCRASFH